MPNACKHIVPNNGTKNNIDTRNFANTSCTSLQSVLDSESLDSNTSTSVVNLVYDGAVVCNSSMNSLNNICNVTKYSHLDVIDSYRSICSSDVSLAPVSRRRGTSQKAPPNSTNSGDGFVCISNTTNTLGHEPNFISTVPAHNVPLRVPRGLFH